MKKLAILLYKKICMLGIPLLGKRQVETDLAQLHPGERVEYIETITGILDSNPSSKTIFPSLKEQIGKKDVPLKELKLEDVRLLYSMLIS